MAGTNEGRRLCNNLGIINTKEYTKRDDGYTFYPDDRSFLQNDYEVGKLYQQCQPMGSRLCHNASLWDFRLCVRNGASNGQMGHSNFLMLTM